MNTPRISRSHHVLARLVTATSVALGTLGAIVPGNVTAQPTPEPGNGCTSHHSMVAEPAIVPHGGSVTVTAHASVNCVASDHPLHIVLVLDTTASMRGEPIAELKRAVNVFVDALDLGPDSTTRVGIVQFDVAAAILCELDGDQEVLEACIDRLGIGDGAGSGGTSIASGILLGTQVLVTGRQSEEQQDDIREALIVLSDGSDSGGCRSVQQVAQQAGAQGVVLVGVCLGPGCDVQCMRSIASSPYWYYEAPSVSALAAVFYQISQALSAPPPFLGLAIPQLALNIRPTQSMQLIDGSQSPGAPILDADGRTWHFTSPPPGGITVTFRIQPHVAGDQPVLESAGGVYSDGFETSAFAFDVPRVVVASGSELPTATPGSPPPLAIATHALSLSPRLLQRGELARLTYQLTFDDPVLPQGSHVALVVDASGSMAGEHNAAAKAAVRSLVGTLPLGDDPSAQVGLVSFNSYAKILQPLTDSRGRIEEAIDLIGASGGTCIHCGILAGRRILEEGRPSPGVEDMVVYADGANNQGCGVVMNAANTLKAEGVTIHTVCMLPGCDTECMAAAASPGHYHEVPQLSALGGAYQSIGNVLGADRRLESLSLTLALPTHIRLVSSSAVPEPSDPANPALVRWELLAVPRGGIDLTAELEAIAVGSAGPMMVAEARLRDGTMQRSVVEAVAGTGIEPTGAPDPATPTPTPTPTISPTYVLCLPWAMR